MLCFPVCSRQSHLFKANGLAYSLLFRWLLYAYPSASPVTTPRAAVQIAPPSENKITTMNKGAAQAAIAKIYAHMLGADHNTFYGKEIGELKTACDDLSSAVRGDKSLAFQASKIVSLLNDGVLAIPQGKSNHRNSILDLCDALLNSLGD